MSIPRSPIKPIEIDIKAAARKAVEDITNFLAIWYPTDPITQTRAALEIAGRWLSRIDGFHDADDFSNLVRDFLLYIQSGGERSRISDQIGHYFGGFMPTYGAACIFMDMVADRRPWSEVQAFMHTLSYGGARRYIETYDWKGSQKKADAEVKAWVDILKEQARTLDTAMADSPVLLAQANPKPAPVYDVPPANDPVMPKPRPPLRVVPPVSGPGVGGAAAEAAERAAGRGVLLRLLAVVPEILVVIIVFWPTSTASDDTMDAYYKAHPDKLPIPEDKAEPSAESNTTNNECKAQIEDNQKNGATCEIDGYWLMERVLNYKRLVDPPKGKGLDGLFEKLTPFGEPNPMPEMVVKPKPGKLIFLPPASTPPQPTYDFTAGAEQRAAANTYPKFVVFEAKHISKTIDENDGKGITQEAKNRLGRTCDGKQMGEKWTDRRIPQALERQYGKDLKTRTDKEEDIKQYRFARWIFVCLPGPVGNAQITRLYVLIDVIGSGMDLESTPPKPRQSKPSAPPNNGY
jgi:hypothetical protein